MKWGSVFFLFTCLLMQNLVSGQENKLEKGVIDVKKSSGVFTITCIGGELQQKNGSTVNELSLSYKDDDSGDYKCKENEDSLEALTTITVRFRTCDNCIELDAPALTAIMIGNLLATFLIACAVYSITGQSKGKNFSGNKASDKVNLITNGDGDTYQHLTGATSEYSRLERKK